MSDLIKLLPDHIANQIAAGEVVQRPASVVKELIENSIDAGATKIQLIAKDGGKTLIQVIDNGSGMSVADAKMSFERHATSKIAKADDLFSLSTKGFRGEALASIAAVAHVSLKTKRVEDEVGVEIVNEGSNIKTEEPVMCTEGTSIAVKNLFFNIPARRNFLGKNTTEYRKIMDEFLRVALVHPNIEMSFHHNDDEIYQLYPSNLRQRIVAVFGKAYNERLVPINEETDIVKISGYVTKPEYCKAKSDQCFLFVNNRFFKDRYLNHAILNAYEDLIPAGKYPPYFIYFEVPPQSIDVNVHPTKTEIKFEENQAIYAFLRSATKQALGQFNVAPTLDFEQERSFDVPALKKGEQVKVPEIKVNPDYNPFKSTASSSGGTSGAIQSNGFSKIQPDKNVWENFYEDAKATEEETEKNEFQEHNEVRLSSSIDDNEGEVIETKKPVQINEKYILSTVKNGFILIDQYRAHMRILFDEIIQKDHPIEVQRLLFPEVLKVSKQDKPYWEEVYDILNSMGFELNRKEDEIEVIGQPVHSKSENPSRLLEEIMESYKLSEQESGMDPREKLAISASASMAIKGGVKLTVEEMQFIIDSLFASSSPQLSPRGKKIIETFTLDELVKRFN